MCFAEPARNQPVVQAFLSLPAVQCCAAGCFVGWACAGRGFPRGSYQAGPHAAEKSRSFAFSWFAHAQARSRFECRARRPYGLASLEIL